MRRPVTILPAISLVLLAACGGGGSGARDHADTTAADSAASVTAPASPLEGVEWALHELGGQPAVAGDPARQPSVRFDADSGRVTGSGGCNRIAGPYTRDGASLRIGPLVATRMACAVERLNRQETAFLAALDATRAYHIAGDTLTLTGTDTTTVRLIARR
jgi:heat shock protein HslJ